MHHKKEKKPPTINGGLTLTEQQLQRICSISSSFCKVAIFESSHQVGHCGLSCQSEEGI